MSQVFRGAYAVRVPDRLRDPRLTLGAILLVPLRVLESVAGRRERTDADPLPEEARSGRGGSGDDRGQGGGEAAKAEKECEAKGKFRRRGR